MAGTVIGDGLTIEGEITGDDEVVVHGTVRGTLTSSGPVSVASTASARRTRWPSPR